eukprot:1187854-Prorocentrum_minimum.AAC.1
MNKICDNDLPMLRLQSHLRADGELGNLGFQYPSMYEQNIRCGGARTPSRLALVVPAFRSSPTDPIDGSDRPVEPSTGSVGDDRKVPARVPPGAHLATTPKAHESSADDQVAAAAA